MPVAIEDSPPPPSVRPSAVTELLWVLLWVQHEWGQKLPATLDRVLPFPEGLGRRVAGFWSDSGRVFSELVYLADASGHLFDTEVEPFLEALDRGFPEIGDLRLRSETPADRAIILERLRLLGSDARLRRRYVALLREVWALTRDAWHEVGLAAVQAGVRLLAERASRAGAVMEIVPDLKHCDDDLLDFVDGAFRRGEVVYSPSYFGGFYLVLDLPGLVLVAAQFDARSRAETRRHQMEVVAGQLRVLADPTRLAILAHLAETPLNVTELVGVLRLSQPTVSAHMRLLREAGVVRPRRQGGRTDYTVERARLDELLHSVGDAIPG